MNKLNNGNLKLGIQKNGRLTEETFDFLSLAGLKFERYERELFSTCRNFPMEIVYLRDDDIPDYVESGAIDMGIVGQNLVREFKPLAQTVLKLGYGRCSLCLAVPNESSIHALEDLKNKTVMTSYPSSVLEFFRRQGIRAKIMTMNGSVEIAPALGIAEAIVDLVSTGKTLALNDLRIVEKIYSSEAVCIANFESLNNSKKIGGIKKIITRFKEVLSNRTYENYKT